MKKLLLLTLLCSNVLGFTTDQGEVFSTDIAGYRRVEITGDAAKSLYDHMSSVTPITENHFGVSVDIKSGRSMSCYLRRVVVSEYLCYVFVDREGVL